MPSRGIAMDFQDPKLVDGELEVEIMAEDVESQVEYWKAGMILFAVG